MNSMKQIRKQVGEQKSATSSLRGRPSWGRSYGRVSIELKISKGYLRASVRGGEDWVTIKDIMNFLGFDVKLVNVVIAPDKGSLTHHTHHSVPRATIVEIKRIQRDLPSRSSLTKPEATSGARKRVR